ncbi:hypothetical protein [Nocardia salmonicida]|nr:hypothetical protein [Nocardia salmonicida]
MPSDSDQHGQWTFDRPMLAGSVSAESDLRVEIFNPAPWDGPTLSQQ